MPIEKVCEYCKKDFKVPNRRSEEVRFCSLACKTAGRRKNVECASCKKMFSCEDHKDRKFCSRLCFHVASKGAKYAVDPSRELHFKDCEVCGKNFRVTLTRKDTARFCSRECQSNSQEFRSEVSERMQGEKHWRWTGGQYINHGGYIRHKKKVLGTETVVLNHRAVMLRLILSEFPQHPFVVIVDGVGKLSPDIEVHHIDRNRSNNEPSNLLAVTKAAHAQIHHHGTKPKPWECWPSDPLIW